jgi:hypothetical protein
MSKTVFSDTPPQGTIVTADFLNAVNTHRHTGEDVDGAGALDYAAAGGSNNAYTLTLSPALAAHIPGMPIRFKANHANTGAATININNLGAVALKRNYNQALTANKLPGHRPGGHPIGAAEREGRPGVCVPGQHTGASGHRQRRAASVCERRG